MVRDKRLVEKVSLRDNYLLWKYVTKDNFYSQYLKSENLTHKLLIAYCIYLENVLVRSYEKLLSQENVIENADSGFLKKTE